MKCIRILILAVLVNFLTIGSSWAGPILILSDGISEVSIIDGGIGDSNTFAGAITYMGGIGNWNLNVTTGLSYPLLGSSSYPILDLNSVDLSSAGGGVLTITFSDTGFNIDNTDITGFYTSIGGTTSGKVTAVSYINDALLVDLGSFTDRAFSDSIGTSVDPDGDFSLKSVVTITHKGAGNTSFDMEIRPVPEPATMLLLGSGLVGLAGFGRKKFFKKG